MVCQLGMSPRLGPLTYGKRQRLAYLDVEGAEERNYSDETAQMIDAEVHALIDEGQKRAKEILTEYRTVLDTITQLLREREVMNGEEIKGLIRQIAKKSK
jgi:cell division protease FtsH